MDGPPVSAPRGRALRRWVSLCGALMLTSCFGNRPVPEVDEVVEVPAQFEAPAPDVSKPALEQWCSDFGQPQLDAAVTRAFEDNLDLRVSWARLDQSMALLRQTESNLYPTVDLQGSAAGNRQQIFGFQPPGPDGSGGGVVVRADVIEQYRASVGASYEVDLWGKLKAQREASRLDVSAARADVETIALSLTSSVASAWFDVIAQRQKRALVEEQIEINERYVELLKLRLAQGSATALDVNQQQQQIELLRGQLQTIDQQRALAEQRLAVLLGQPPAQGAELVDASIAELPALPELPGAGVPADLLERRPDLRSAQLRLEAANKRIAVAVRQRLPSLRLSASLFLQAQELGNLLDELLWSLTASLAQPLIDGGRMRAEVARAEAAQREALYNYAKTLLTAINEVEGAMVSEHYQANFIEELERQRDLAASSLELARARYQRGGLDFLRVLTSLQALQQIEQNLVDARRLQLSNRIQLCRALGGTWTRQLEAPGQED